MDFNLNQENFSDENGMRVTQALLKAFYGLDGGQEQLEGLIDHISYLSRDRGNSLEISDFILDFLESDHSKK